jgi:hypothetical protein
MQKSIKNTNKWKLFVLKLIYYMVIIYIMLKGMFPTLIKLWNNFISTKKNKFVLKVQINFI